MGLTAAEIWYQHLAWSDHEEELLSSESGDGHRYGRHHLTLATGIEKQNLFWNHSCQGRNLWNKHHDLFSSPFQSPGWCPRSPPHWMKPHLCETLSEVSLMDQKARQKRPENGSKAGKQIENNQNVGLSLVQVYYTQCSAWKWSFLKIKWSINKITSTDIPSFPI